MIHNGDRFFRARSIALLRRTLAWLSASHEFDNAFPVLAAVFLAEFFLKDWQYRPVELLRLGDAHAVHLKTDDGQARPGKHFDYAAGPQIWEFEVVGLDQDECLFDLRVRGEADGAIQDAAVGIGKIRPELQIALDCFWIERRQHAGLEVGYFA